MASRSLEWLSIFFPLPLNFVGFLGSSAFILLILCVSLAVLLQMTLHWHRLKISRPFRRWGIFPPEWAPDPRWLCWLMHLQVQFKAGHSFASTLAQNPASIGWSEGELSSIQKLSLYLEHHERDSGWKSFSLKLLLHAYESGLSFIGILIPLIDVQKEWLHSLSEMKTQFRPILLQCVCGLTIPPLTLVAMKIFFPDLPLIGPWLWIALFLFLLGVVTEILFLRYFRKAVMQSFETCHPASVPMSFLFIQLCRLSVISGMALESSINFSLCALLKDDFYGFSLQRTRENPACPEEVQPWFPKDWWESFVQLVQNTADRGTSFADSLQSMYELCQYQWKSQIQLKLKTMPFLMFLPLGLFILPGSMCLLLGPFLSQIS